MNPLNDFNIDILCLSSIRYAFYRRAVPATLNTIDGIVYVLDNMENDDHKYNFILKLITEIENIFSLNEELEINYIWNEFLQDLVEKRNGFYKQ